MNMPAFANLRFGHWSQTLVGQINRKHYYFVVDSKNKIQGFSGLGDYYEGQGRGLGRRRRRIVREWHRRRLLRIECVGGKHARGEQLSVQGSAQDPRREREGGALFQAHLHGRQDQVRPRARSHQTESRGRGIIPVERIDAHLKHAEPSAECLRRSQTQFLRGSGWALPKIISIAHRDWAEVVHSISLHPCASAAFRTGFEDEATAR